MKFGLWKRQRNGIFQSGWSLVQSRATMNTSSGRCSNNKVRQDKHSERDVDGDMALQIQAKLTKRRKLPNYSIKQVEISKRGLLNKAGHGRTSAVCPLNSKTPNPLNFCSNSSFRLAGTSSPRRRNAPVALRTRLNDSFDRHLLLEQVWAVE